MQLRCSHRHASEARPHCRWKLEEDDPPDAALLEAVLLPELLPALLPAVLPLLEGPWLPPTVVGTLRAAADDKPCSMLTLWLCCDIGVRPFRARPRAE